MQTVFETQKKVVDKQLCNYIVSKLEINDELTQMTVYVRDSKYVNTVQQRLQRVSQVAGLDDSPSIKFESIFDTNNSKIIFKGDVKQATQFLLAYESISNKTSAEINSFFVKKNAADGCTVM